jgi:hypothetical protein
MSGAFRFVVVVMRLAVFILGQVEKFLVSNSELTRALIFSTDNVVYFSTKLF